MITYGFYDSLNGDRKYSAIQFGSMFDGMVQDGIFMSIGTCFRVTPGEGMMLQVGIGRAWFDHTWTLNDAIMPIYLDQSELLLNRIDAIVIDVDHRQEYRKNDIIVIKGTPATVPEKPVLEKTSLHKQYPLAYVTVSAKVTAIRAADIESAIGTSATPYVTGLLETVNIDALLDQWKDQWLRFYEIQTKEMQDTNAYWKETWEEFYNAQEAEILATNDLWKETWSQFFETQETEMMRTNDYWRRTWVSFFEEKKNEINATKLAWENQWEEWYNYFTKKANDDYEEWKNAIDLWYSEYVTKMNSEMTKNKEQWQVWFNTYTNENRQDYLTWKDSLDVSFKRWFNSLQGSLEGDFATSLANEIALLKDRVSELEEFKNDVIIDNVIWNPLTDSDGSYILDSNGEQIKAKTKILVVSQNTIDKYQ